MAWGSDSPYLVVLPILLYPIIYIYIPAKDRNIIYSIIYIIHFTKIKINWPVGILSLSKKKEVKYTDGIAGDQILLLPLGNSIA